MRLTVTKVVFELASNFRLVWSILGLTVTKVVFEFGSIPIQVAKLPRINSNKSCF